jgi:pentatricopeptide repeat protein
MASPVDVGGLPNHVKYCVSVLSLQWENIRTSPVGIPYIYDIIIIAMCRSRKLKDALELFSELIQRVAA